MVSARLCTYSTYVGQVHQDRWLPWELGIKHDCNLLEKSTCGQAPALAPRNPSQQLTLSDYPADYVGIFTAVKVNNVKTRLASACEEFPLLAIRRETRHHFRLIIQHTSAQSEAHR